MEAGEKERLREARKRYVLSILVCEYISENKYLLSTVKMEMRQLSRSIRRLGVKNFRLRRSRIASVHISVYVGGICLVCRLW